MGFKCCVPSCTTGYATDDGQGKVSLHRFPLENVDLLHQWIQRIPRKDFTPTKHSRVCALHFHDFDFESIRNDTNKWRDRGALVRCYLKPTAVPSIFPNLPPYYSHSIPTPRSESATSCSRHQRDQEQLESLEARLFEEDRISSISQLVEKYNSHPYKPASFSMLPFLPDAVIFMIIDISDVPSISQSVRVDSDLSFKVFSDSILISHAQFSSIMQNCKTLAHFSDLLNLLSFLSNPTNTSVKDCLRFYLSKIEELLLRNDMIPSLIQSLSFLCQQILLSLTDKKLRRYSPEFLSRALLWYSKSSSCYSQIRQDGLLVLPSERRLRSLQSKIKLVDKNPSAYLLVRIGGLNDYERNVCLIFDEVYIYQRVDFCGEQFLGLSDDGKTPATTVLVFMIKSLASSYRDVITMYPISSLNVQKLSVYFHESLQLAEQSGFNVVLSVCDNHATNRAFYSRSLCNGTLLSEIPHPCDPDKPLFLTFDATHNIKNVFNNWETKRKFHLPEFRGAVAIHPDYHYIEHLCSVEQNKPLKMAFRLSPFFLHPSAIQKSSVKPATNVFCDSTLAALEYFSKEQYPSWKDTVEFVRKFLCMWKILNTKTKSHGYQKKDPFYEPISSSDHPNLIFLDDLADEVESWKSSGLAGFTSPTFIAILQSLRTIPALCRHLLDKQGFAFILPGHFQSDPLEQRFGWYRQLCGANFFISVKQIMESECKIKVCSLLKQSSTPLAALNSIQEMSTEMADSEVDPTELLSGLNLDDSECQWEECDLNSLYYVAGYIARKVSRSCDSCVSVFSDDTPMPDLDIQGDPSFFNLINRGGLTRPSESMLELICLGYRIYCQIRDDPDRMNLLINSPHSTSLYVTASLHLINESPTYGSCCICTFSGGFCITAKRALTCLFHILAKNLMKTFTSSPSPAVPRKIAKLNAERM
jgi:hypothetical protein